ncbi:shikimate dehydrogenase [Mesorhizobium microcysteis]|uniref:Shikimate dehydrogenase n=1 Tax=Neoaquamicrobium microcysteis TaxID=2682781 RepID=A0A5D4GSM2_9HYPH|nr:shikimate dehydrogenase [Mesorhizobium microcysteis]TYR30903.1 shikimate dehydrogenase [Mesorhizobium microcysteis]
MPDRVGEVASAIEPLLTRRFGEIGGRADVLVGLVGRGIQLSRTPVMHEREASRLGLSCAYVLIDFDAAGLADSDLPAVLQAAADLGFHGLNVTYPFKQSVMALLDDVSPEADAIGAVNTIVFGPRKTGHNTDYWGFAESFRTRMPGVPLGRIAVFGAGGAGSAVCAAFIGLGAGEITIVDPDGARASELAQRLSGAGGARVLVAEDKQQAVKLADGIVNTTPIGMAKLPGTPFPVEWLRPEQWVADVIYFPRETELLRHASEIGCQTLPGIGMAIGQAVRAFEHFTGRAADMAEMARHFEAAA